MQDRPKDESSNANKPVITHFLTMGDSLSDRGTLKKRKTLGLPIIGVLSGLGKSPRGRFTNGYTWADSFSSYYNNQFAINYFNKKSTVHNRNNAINNQIANLKNEDSPWNKAADFSDSIIAQTKFRSKLHEAYQLNDYHGVRFGNDIDFVRNYNEGGLTSHSYFGKFSFNPIKFFTRLTISTLDKKRKEVLKCDQEFGTPLEKKAQTLVIEWSGANDLITANGKPTFPEADKAIEARIKNIEELIKQGYKNFALFNLPDLSLTPRFQRKSEEDKINAQEVCEYFNLRLKTRIDELNKIQKPESKIKINYIDINSKFTDIYHNPEKYGLKNDRKYKTTPFLESDEYKNRKDKKKSDSDNYLFWDDVHPTADVHALLGVAVCEELDKLYRVQEPNDFDVKSLLENFKKAYLAKCKEHKSIFSLNFFFPKIIYYPNMVNNIEQSMKEMTPEMVLEQLFKIKKYDKSINEIMKKLGWIDNRGHIVPEIDRLMNPHAHHEPLSPEQKGGRHSRRRDSI